MECVGRPSRLPCSRNAILASIKPMRAEDFTSLSGFATVVFRAESKSALQVYSRFGCVLPALPVFSKKSSQGIPIRRRRGCGKGDLPDRRERQFGRKTRVGGR